MWAHRVGTLERFCPCGTCESRRRRSCRSEKSTLTLLSLLKKGAGLPLVDSLALCLPCRGGCSVIVRPAGASGGLFTSSQTVSASAGIAAGSNCAARFRSVGLCGAFSARTVNYTSAPLGALRGNSRARERSTKVNRRGGLNLQRGAGSDRRQSCRAGPPLQTGDCSGRSGREKKRLILLPFCYRFAPRKTLEKHSFFVLLLCCFCIHRKGAVFPCSCGL